MSGITQLLYLGTEVSISEVSIRGGTCGDWHVTSSICLYTLSATINAYILAALFLLSNTADAVGQSTARSQEGRQKTGEANGDATFYFLLCSFGLYKSDNCCAVGGASKGSVWVGVSFFYSYELYKIMRQLSTRSCMAWSHWHKGVCRAHHKKRAALFKSKHEDTPLPGGQEHARFYKHTFCI